jgi:NADH dehydrogenase
MDRRHRIVILGGGFAGLYCARALKKVKASVTIIDKRNHHLFQPLLYQVATGGLSPGDIAEPIRNIVRRQKNADVLLGEVESVDVERQVVCLTDGEVAYDTLIVCTGLQNQYFGNDEWEALAPGLKSLEDAVTIRRRFLMAFERAEREPDPERRRRLLTFVVIGGGPTGVELAGTMAEMARKSLPRDFRRFTGEDTRLLLVEGGDRLLSAFPESLSESASKQLGELGVEIRTGVRVTDISEQAVTLGEEVIATPNVFWAAGVCASPLLKSLGGEVDRMGRVKVAPDCTVPGHPEVFVVGDCAHMADAAGKLVPGVAQGAIQMGRYAAEVIKARAGNGVLPGPFVYTDKGTLATIGRSRAVGVIGDREISGFVAWVLWLFIHLVFLIGFDNQLIVLIQWAWSYLQYKQGARLITDRYHTHDDPRG